MKRHSREFFDLGLVEDYMLLLLLMLLLLTILPFAGSGETGLSRIFDLGLV